ncbi:hypothetical protein [Nocardia yamanashiensis]|uniref:hypothetical protein n=1 Tax=Nocardia yamanashiensis TaxID=209247 RepID=UPI0012FDAEF0|nr:hypothetical protein [Nocardia yamanashiensis]
MRVAVSTLLLAAALGLTACSSNQSAAPATSSTAPATSSSASSTVAPSSTTASNGPGGSEGSGGQGNSGGGASGGEPATVPATAAPAEPTATAAPATTVAKPGDVGFDWCSRVGLADLKQVLGLPGIEIDRWKCVDSWAMLHSAHSDKYPQPTGYLLHPNVQGFWQLVTQGSAIDCNEAYNVPKNVAAQLQGCR